MELFATLLIFTFSYSLLFLSLFPLKAIKRIDKFAEDTKDALYKRYDLTMPYFLSFLGGYIVASVMVYFILDSI